MNTGKTIVRQKMVDAVFIQYDGGDRCARCIYAYNKRMCEKVKCLSDERNDGKSGYYRGKNMNPFEKDPTMRIK